MSTRHIALAGTFLALIFLAHAASRFTQVGGAQATGAIAFWVILALLLGPELRWESLVGIGIGTGLMLMLATSSPVPPAAFLAGCVGFLASSAIAKLIAPKGANVGFGGIFLDILVTGPIAWTMLCTLTWLVLSASPFGNRNFAVYGLAFGQGYVAWWIFGFLAIMLPSMIFAWILVPILYPPVHQALVRQGMLRSPEKVA
jgi:hypothetical protein